jgi:hypothetical protein
MTIFPQCLGCKHFHSNTDLGEPLTCDAFPGGIPDAILLNKHDHREPYPGDHGILFEPIDGDSEVSDDGSQ